MIRSFCQQTGWNYDNSYTQLDCTSQAILDFSVRGGCNLQVLSLAGPVFVSKGEISAVPTLRGSLSYLYSTLPSQAFARDIEAGGGGFGQIYVPAYRMVTMRKDVPDKGAAKDKLLFGRMYIPENRLEALYVRRVSSGTLMTLRYASQMLHNLDTTLTAQMQMDKGKWSTETVYSTDDGILGFRGLWNFGPYPQAEQLLQQHHGHQQPRYPEPQGLLSAGAEVYYALANKNAGMSMGLRYTTLPTYPLNPVTMTLVVNPVMGHVSTAYSTRLLDSNTAYSTRYTFNAHSYESQLDIGAERWNEHGVVKASIGTNRAMRVSWAFRWKNMMLNIGLHFGLEGVHAAGIELGYHHD